METDLKSCPKCGSNDIKQDYDFGEVVYICQNCECEFDENGIEM